MEYTKGYKFRLYPNKTQKILLNKILGCYRFVYNRFLTVRKESWEKDKYTQTSSMLTRLKKEIFWLNEADSIALQQSLRNLDTREIHGKILNARLDFLHKESIKLCRENQTIAFESLQVKNLMRNHKLAKAISDASWGESLRL